MPTISDIARVSYPAVLEAMREGTDYPDWHLRQLDREGKLALVGLGAVVEFEGLRYPVIPLTTPCVWTDEDEARNQTEAQKINLVRALLTNGIESHADSIRERIGRNRGMLSHHFNFGMGGIHKTFHNDPGEQPWASYSFRIYSGMAVVHAEQELPRG